jgi:exodeoxyribonuclease-3
MKIASFNVNGLRARVSVVLEWLEKQSPDVLCLQETKVQDEEFPKEAFEKSGYEYIYAGQKSYNGVAIFSKGPIKNAEYGFKEEPRDKSRFIKAEINGVQYKLNWFRRLLKYLENNFKPAEPILWMGDFNVAPQAIDVYDPEGLAGHVCFNPEVTEALGFVCEWGFVDLFRQHCADGGQYTFWDYRMRGSFKRNLGWRLDHIMATKAMADKCRSCYIDKEPRAVERPSDHTPIVAEFDI